MKIVHYVNQFFAGMGGEDSAGAGPEMRDGATGPGRKLAGLLGDEHRSEEHTSELQSRI